MPFLLTNVSFDNLSRDMSSSPYVVGWRPEHTSPELFLQLWKLFEHVQASNALEYLDNIHRRVKRVSLYEQVYVVWHYSQFKNLVTLCLSNGAKLVFKKLLDLLSEYSLSVLRTPDDMIVDVVDG